MMPYRLTKLPPLAKIAQRYFSQQTANQELEFGSKVMLRHG